MITKIEVEDWKSHSHSSFAFVKGTNVLLGRMGSGKSSVLDALCFALYGTFPKISRRDQSTDALVNFTSGSPYAKVLLEFTKAGKTYAITRKIGKKISEAEISCDGKLVQKGAKAVTDYVASTLGVDYELFTRAIYSEQNRIDYLLSLTPRSRKQEIDWLLGLGRFDEAREAAQAASGKLSENERLLSADASPQKIAELSSKAAELDSQVAERKSQHEKLAKKATEISEASKAKDAALHSLEKTRAEWTRAKTDCDILRGSLSRFTRETDGKRQLKNEEADALLGHFKTEEKRLREAKAGAKKFATDLSSIKSESAVLQSTIKLCQERHAKKEELGQKLAKITGGNDISQIEAQIASLKSETERLSQERALLIAESEELLSAIKSLSSTSAKCPVCDSDLSHGKSGHIAEEKKKLAGEKKRKEQSFSTGLSQKKNSLSQLEASVSQAKLLAAQIERLSAEGTDAAQYKSRLAALLSQQKSLEENQQEAEKAISALDEAVTATRTKHEEAKRTLALFSELETAKQKFSASEQKLASLQFDEAKYETARKEAETLRVELTRLKTELSGEEKQLKLVIELLTVSKTDLVSLQEKEKIAKKYSEAAQSMLIYKNSLSSAQSELRSLLIEEINLALSEIWPAVYPYSDYGGVKIEADEKDYRMLMQRADWQDVDSVASGGERACLCLALRIAFAAVLTPDIGWLILDEPTHNLDEDAVLLLSEAISGKMPSIVEQTFVITHEQSLGETTSGKVFRLERDKNKNENTRVLLA